MGAYYHDGEYIGANSPIDDSTPDEHKVYSSAKTEEKMETALGSSTLLHTTGSGTSVNVTADISKYKFLFITLGSGTGNYGSELIPTATILAEQKTSAKVVAYNANATQIIAVANLSYGTNKTLTTSNSDYPAMLYGIK